MTCWQAPLLWNWGLRRGCPRPSRRLRAQADLAHPPNSLRHLREYPLGEGNGTAFQQWVCFTIPACRSASGCLRPSLRQPGGTPMSTGTGPQFHSGLEPGPEPTAQTASKPLFSLSFQMAPGLIYASPLDVHSAQLSTWNIVLVLQGPSVTFRCEKGVLQISC